MARDRLPQEYAGPDPLDMQQYRDVLGTCRIPGTDHDSLQFHPSSEHVLVAHRGHVRRAGWLARGRGGLVTSV